MKHASLCILLLFVVLQQAQAQKTTSLSAGAELDLLPYATGGYFAAGWVGKQQWRLRVLTADVNKPDWSISRNFRNHHITAYALVVDYFLKPGWKGWWIGGGPVYWKSTIQSDALQQTASFHNWLLNGSLGYQLPVYKKLYCSPWAGLTIRTGGDRNVPVDTKTFTLPLLNPEASFKIGIWF